MQLRVGPFMYRVVQVPGFIRFEGDDCLGLCDNEQHELMISQQCSDAQQVQVLCHEYMEAWLYHFGQGVDDKEDYCDLFGLAMTQFVFELMRLMRQQGGTLPSLLASALADKHLSKDKPTAFEAPNAGARRLARRTGGAVTAIKVTDRLMAGPDDKDVWRVRVFEALGDADAANDGPDASATS